MVGSDHAAVGLVYLCLGRLREAERELRVALKVQDTHPVSEELGVTLTSLGQVRFILSDLGGAERFWRRALTVLDQFPDPAAGRGALMGNLAGLFYTRGQIREAEHHAAAALPLLEGRTDAASQRAETRNILGLIYLARVDLRQAEDTLRTAIQAAGPDERAAANSFRHLGWVLVKGKRCPEAVECFRTALEMNRRTMGERHEVLPDLLIEYSEGLRACGQKEEAKRLKAHAEALGGARPRTGDTVDIRALRRE